MTEVAYTSLYCIIIIAHLGAMLLIIIIITTIIIKLHYFLSITTIEPLTSIRDIFSCSCPMKTNSGSFESSLNGDYDPI